MQLNFVSVPILPGQEKSKKSMQKTQVPGRPREEQWLSILENREQNVQQINSE